MPHYVTSLDGQWPAETLRFVYRLTQRGPKKTARKRALEDVEVPMVYDGYFGGFVPVGSASFDVSLNPEAIVELPLSVLDAQRATAESLEQRREARAARRARPRCDLRDHFVETVTRANDGLLALCDECLGGLDVSTLDSPTLLDTLISRIDDRKRVKYRRILDRRLVMRTQERDLASGAIGHCRLCGRFRRILQTRDGVLLACRACAQGAPIAELDGEAAARALVERRSPAARSAFVAHLADWFPALV
jgi:hypothetical protein